MTGEELSLEERVEALVMEIQIKNKDRAVDQNHLAWKLAEDYGEQKWLKHGNSSYAREYTIARDAYYQGYLAAKAEMED